VRVFSFILVGLLGMGSPSSVSGQWPGELRGRVVDGLSRVPVAGAVVTVSGHPSSIASDASGRFHVRGLGPGMHTVWVARVGYLPLQAAVEIRNGRVSRPEYALTPDPVMLEGIAAAPRRTDAGSWVIRRESLLAQGARTAGDALRTLPMVLVREDRPGGPQTVSIRGGSADATLVLVDGVPWNDPLTGVADLGRIPASAIDKITVLPGGRTARYGAGARGGVVLVSTRVGETEWGVGVAGGTLGRVRLEAEYGGRRSALRWTTTASYERVGGDFAFELPQEIGGGAALRENADTWTQALWTGISAPLAGGDLRVRAGLERDGRGLPGKSFAPSRNARASHTRAQVSSDWRRDTEAGELRSAIFLSTDRAELNDPDPPAGVPYDDRWRSSSVGLRGAWSGADEGLWLGEWGLGAEGTVQRITSTVLSDRAPSARLDVNLFLHAVAHPLSRSGPTLAGALGVHRDPTGGTPKVTHELRLDSSKGLVRAHLAHRSSYNAPSPADQFFREGVAVAANPELGAEWVPSELEVGVEARQSWSRTSVSGGTNAYVADVRGLIVWMPDFRFVWSPRNVDVRRRGLDAWVRATHSLDLGEVGLGATYGLQRVTYDRPGGTQVLYRPRHIASARGWLTRGGWRVDVTARFTGARFPVASAVNELGAFTTVDLRLSRRWEQGGRTLSLTLDVRRFGGETDTLIFGFPHPGRTVDLGLHIRPSQTIPSAGHNP
jgi:vitamin B12 transporter